MVKDRIKLKIKELAFLLAASSILLSGCVYESDSVDFQVNEKKEQQKPPQFKNAQTLIEEAVEKTLLNDGTEQAVENFWFQGYIRNEIGKRTNNSMYNGIIENPNNYYVDARLTGTPYSYYRLGHKVYISQDNEWFKAEKDPLPFAPVEGFQHWFPFLDKAIQLEDESILSEPCSVMEISLTGDEWVKESTYPSFQTFPQDLSNYEDIEVLLKDATVKMKLWIGKEDKRIYQYQTITEIPVPETGALRQTTFFRFYKFNDPGIKLKTEEELEALVQKRIENEQ